MTIREARRLCGAFLQAEPSEDVMPKPLSDDPVPAAFDARQKWPNSIHPIRNQVRISLHFREKRFFELALCQYSRQIAVVVGRSPPLVFLRILYIEIFYLYFYVESLSDRFAIQSNNSVEVVLSPQDLVSCDNSDGDEGCMGGFPIRAWKYMKSTG